MMNSTQVRKWSVAHEDELLKMFKDKTPVSDMAKKLERGEGAVLIRLKKIATRLHTEGLNFDDIYIKTGVSQEVLEEQLKIDARVQNKKLSNSSALIKAKLKEIEAILP